MADKFEKTGNPIIDAQQERIAETYSHDTNRLRWAVGIALAFHLVFLAVRLPDLTEAQPPPPEEEDPYVIHQVKFRPPPPPEPEKEPPPPPKEEPAPPKPEAVKIPIPDPEPQEPEPPPTHEEVVEFAEEEPLRQPVAMPAPQVQVQIPAPPPPPPEPTGPIRVGGAVKAPVKVRTPHPEYTEPARAARVEGTVIIEAVIDKQGNVTSTKVVKDLPMGLGEAAQRTVKSWKFKPGTLHGRPVSVIYNLTVNFKLD
jgi:protein TonB